MLNQIPTNRGHVCIVFSLHYTHSPKPCELLVGHLRSHAETVPEGDVMQLLSPSPSDAADPCNHSLLFHETNALHICRWVHFLLFLFLNSCNFRFKLFHF